MSILRRLFPPVKASNDAPLMAFESAHRIVRDYGDFLQTSAPLPGCVADEKQLPHAKIHIKDAIGVYVNTIGERGVTEELKHGYLMLSAWQDGVGDQPLGVNFSEFDLDEDPLLVAQKIQDQSATMGKWKPIIEADQAELISEFELLTA
ncbi:MAG: hypothetical protein DRR06_13865 [Gammaproteobacteria bacterium]|nr:MAG: hypothetical protein DRR06_13865 [Gammaproteobacteria bacterium]